MTEEGSSKRSLLSVKQVGTVFFVEGCTNVKRNVFSSFLQEQSNSGLIVVFCLSSAFSFLIAW